MTQLHLKRSRAAGRLARLSLFSAAVLIFVAACSANEDVAGSTVVATLPVATAIPTVVPPPATVTAITTAVPTATQASTSTETSVPTETATTAPTATPSPLPTRAPDLSTLTVVLESVAEGLDQPVFATHAGDGSGRVFAVEKGGTIRILDGSSVLSQPFLDIAGRVGSSASEQGLLGLAFDPDFSANGRLYVYYTDGNGDTVISRFQANDERTQADPDSEVVLITQPQPAGNHNGGMVAFGPDGYLYAGLGDGGAAGDRFGNGQNLGTILGTVIRIDVAGEQAAVPADNPFVDQQNAWPEIWAYGLRNPWRFSFDRQTGDLWIGDVGQNQWEEINFQPAGSPGGENYGWPITEASHCYGADTCDTTGQTLAVAEYEHSLGCSVTGGYVYRGTQQAAMQGIYFFGDYCTGRVWGLAQVVGGGWQSVELLDSRAQISSLGETEEGELLVVAYDGTIYRLVAQ